MYCQTERSSRRKMRRVTCSPQPSPAVSEKRSWLNGMRISALHPALSTEVAACHTGSQLVSQMFPSSETYSSPRTPLALVVKENAVRWSPRLSRFTSTQSPGNQSRRASCRSIRAGSSSWQRKPRYIASAP